MPSLVRACCCPDAVCLCDDPAYDVWQAHYQIDPCGCFVPYVCSAHGTRVEFQFPLIGDVQLVRAYTEPAINYCVWEAPLGLMEIWADTDLVHACDGYQGSMTVYLAAVFNDPLVPNALMVSMYGLREFPPAFFGLGDWGPAVPCPPALIGGVFSPSWSVDPDQPCGLLSCGDGDFSLVPISVASSVVLSR